MTYWSRHPGSSALVLPCCSRAAAVVRVCGAGIQGNTRGSWSFTLSSVCLISCTSTTFFGHECVCVVVGCTGSTLASCDGP